MSNSTNSFSQLSASFAKLTSMERRFIIAVLAVVFIVLNLVFVLPHFGELGKIDNRFRDAETKLKKYETEIARKASYETGIKSLESEGAAVPQEDQAVTVLQAIQNQAAQSGVSVLANNRQPERTNQFFVERAQALTTQSGEKELVDFLYNLGSGSSLIRVRALSVRPDATRQGMSANITLIASFQKKVPAKVTPPPAPKPAPVATPVAKPNPASAPPAAKPSTSTKK